MNLAINTINGAWWVAQAVWVGSEMSDLSKDVKDKYEDPENRTTRGYVAMSAKALTIAFDILSLNLDWRSSHLDGAKLDKNKINSAKFQAAAFTTNVAAKVAEGKPIFDREAAIRLLALCRRYGQGIHSPALNYVPTAIQWEPVFTIASEIIYNQFANWYRMHSLAPHVVFDVDYEGIPDEFHSNPIFQQFTCPISKEPIRYPITVPNKLGGPDHHFERKNLLKWLERHDTNPVTNLPLEVSELRENDDMREIIEEEMIKLDIPI